MQMWNKIMAAPLRPPLTTAAAAAGAESGDQAAASGVPSDDEYQGKRTIDQLVLSYLAHHGYAKTARAFEAHCERRETLWAGAAGERRNPIFLYHVLNPVASYRS
jgi:hypothetical protein